MHPSLRFLLKDVQECFATCMVTDEVVNGDSERLMKHVQRQLAGELAEFIMESKLLDGTDPSGFDMARRYDLLATQYRVRAIVLTPNELRTLLQAAFDRGVAHADDERPTDYHSPVFAKEAFGKAMAEAMDRSILSNLFKKK